MHVNHLNSIGTLGRNAGISLIISAFLGICITAGSVPVPGVDATGMQPNLHEAASKTVVPKHKAAALLAVANQPDIKPAHRVLADQVLRNLPPFCRDNLKNFYVNYDKHPANRGLGGESTVIITGNVPDKEFMALLIHECGHVTDLGGLRGNDTRRPTNFFDGSTPIYGNDPSVQFYQISWMTPKIIIPGLGDADFVSGYAMSDPFEDFAETFAYFALQRKEFARLATKNNVLKAKYDFMATFVFADTPMIADGQSKRGKSVPWDVTKLPYVWHAKK